MRSGARAEGHTPAIIPCGPSCWYPPFTDLVNRERVSLHGLTVFHMDECLDWQGSAAAQEPPLQLPRLHGAALLRAHRPDLAVPEEDRCWLRRQHRVGARRIWAAPIDITYGGWGQDGHIAYNQARRHPFSHISGGADLRQSRRAHPGEQLRHHPGTGPAHLRRRLSVRATRCPLTLGVSECLSAGKVRLFSDTGAWKQTALRVALFGPVTAEYPMTLLQEHADALITATVETARHPISEHPEWELL